MSDSEDGKVCLNVAVDHRIRQLYNPVQIDTSTPSSHVSRIKTRGATLLCSEDEIDVTAQLARPAAKGGIVVMLQQPRANHPFQKGIDAVIEDCDTLKAVDDIFSTVSCKTLDIRTNVTVLDLLPFVSDGAYSMPDDKLRDSFRTSVGAICDKEPDVVVCAGRIRTKKFDASKAEAMNLECIGVGKVFGARSSPPIEARIRNPGGGFLKIPRVNAFHPSHAINYNPHVSNFRQLLLLNGVEACARVRSDDWDDEEWMVDLRSRSQITSNQLSTPPSASLARHSNTQRPRYFPDYQDLYSDKLLDIQQHIVHIFLYSPLNPESPSKLYQDIMSRDLTTAGAGVSLSELCNDASLLLREMARLQQTDWSESMARNIELSLQDATGDTVDFIRQLRKIVKASGASQFASIIRRFVDSIADCIAVKVRNGDELPDIELMQGCVAFLDLATEIESLLLKLHEEVTRQNRVVADELSSHLENMTLSKEKIGPVVGVTEVTLA